MRTKSSIASLNISPTWSCIKYFFLHRLHWTLSAFNINSHAWIHTTRSRLSLNLKMFFLIIGTLNYCPKAMISNYELRGTFYDRMYCLFFFFFNSSLIQKFMPRLHIRLIQAVSTILANMPLFLTFKLPAVILKKTITLYTGLIQRCIFLLINIRVVKPEPNRAESRSKFYH